MTVEFDEKENAAKLSLIKESFKNVLDSDVHLDNKASRTLSAMAFLTAAAAAVFARVFPLPDKMPSLTLWGIQWALLSFAIFGILMLLGSLMYIAALGPSLNIKHFQHQKQKDGEPKSLLFFETIGQLTITDWANYWNNTRHEDLTLKILNNFAAETLLIAEKTRSKYVFMSIGSVFLKFAILFLSFLIVGLVTNDLTLFRILAVIVAGLWISAILFETVTRPNWAKRQPRLKLAGLLIIGIVVFVLVSTTELRGSSTSPVTPVGATPGSTPTETATIIPMSTP